MREKHYYLANKPRLKPINEHAKYRSIILIIFSNVAGWPYRLLITWPMAIIIIGARAVPVSNGRMIVNKNNVPGPLVCR